MPDVVERLTAALEGRYRIERELGRGGMATVYLALDLKHERQVAIKVLRPELAAALGADRFLREIKTTANLRHPHILPLYDSGEASGFLFYVMPYVAGESLRDRLDREKQLPVDDALQIAREVADALSNAHSHDVVHRDIKPENILLEAGHAVVADFGIARAVTAAGGDRLTETGMAIGTPRYMSPEQAAGSREVDGRSDLYSLGCVLYEMLGGQPPFTGPTAENLVHQHLAAQPPPITNLRPAVPAHVATALMRVLAKTPADRFSPAAQFAEAIRPPSGPVTEATPVGLATWSDPLRAGILFGLTAVILLGLVRVLVVQLGLPDWVFLGVVGLLLIGLPIVVVTGLAEQRRAAAGGTARGAESSRSLLTWRRTMLGGATAFGALSLVTASYVAMRALGIGPAGTLIARGVIAERQPILLADIENRTADSTHGATVTELMRISLSRSTTVSVLDPVQVARILELMQRDPTAGLPPEVAMEAAEREGIGAVITGEVVPLGRGLSITARLVSIDGDVLVAQQETAADADGLVGAVDRLTAGLRERFGESLRSIRANQPLERVTTGSMRALRLYSQAMVAWNQGDVARAMQMLEEVITIDSGFAMAHRKLAIILNNQNERRSQAVEAATKAYEFRDRLPDRERYKVIAAYHSVVTGDRDQVISAYRSLLDLYPDDIYGLNNLGVIYGALRDFERAADYYARALAVDSATRLHYSNLAYALEKQEQFDSASRIIARFEKRFPDNPEVLISHIVHAAMRRDFDEAVHLGDSLMAAQRGTVFWEATAHEWLGSVAAMRGRVTSARQAWDRALKVTGDRGLQGQYLFRAARRAVVQGLVLENPADIKAILDNALARFPLETLRPLDRPYGHLALGYAAAGETDRARALVAEYEATLEADHGLDAERWVSGARGIIALAEGRHDDAIRELWRFDDGNACHSCSWAWLARAYEQAGRLDSARTLYEEFVDIRSASIYYDGAHLPYSLNRLGELHEAGGDRAKALDYYGRFVAMWEHADPELQPRVEQARRAMARLAGERRSP